MTQHHRLTGRGFGFFGDKDDKIKEIEN
jgi:hypothetical protein